jgi:hypothetical protein
MEANMKLDIRDRRTQLGVALVALGLLALFGNLGIFAGLGRLIGLLLFGAAGVIVLRMYRDEPSRIWTLPAGFALLGLGVASLDLPWSGGAFLGSIGLGFLAIWLTDDERWWALIPAGVLMTLGVVATYDEWLGRGGDFGGTLFFLGLAATFAALYLLPRVNQSWAIWPALGLGVIALLTMSFRGGWVVPILLIGVGAWLLTRQSRPADVRPVEPPVPTPPAPTAPPSEAAGSDAPTSDASVASDEASAVASAEAATSETRPAEDASTREERPADDAAEERTDVDGGPARPDDEEERREF